MSWTRPTGKMPQHQRLQLIMYRERDSAAAKRRRPHPVRVVETSPLPLHSPSLRPPPVVGASSTKTRIASEDRPVPRTCQNQRERPVPPALLTPALQAGGCSLRNGVADQLVNATITAQCSPPNPAAERPLPTTSSSVPRGGEASPLMLQAVASGVKGGPAQVTTRPSALVSPSPQINGDAATGYVVEAGVKSLTKASSETRGTYFFSCLGQSQAATRDV